MLSTKDVAMIYETLLSSPGMNDAVRIDVKLPRKNVLLLTKVIELGLSLKDQTPKGDYCIQLLLKLSRILEVSPVSF